MQKLSYLSILQLKSWLFLLAVLSLASCSRNKIDMSELPPEYRVSPPEELYMVPVILEGQVIETCKPIGSIHASRWDGYPQQLWQVKVRVEHVLQGDVPEHEVNIYYFVYRGNLGSSEAGLTDLFAGDREIFLLQRDNGQLRTICDGAHNCVVKVRTGAHPYYKRSDSTTINDAILDILLTRGEGATDKQLLAALQYTGNFGEQATIRALERLVKTETPEVAERACLSLENGYRHKCPEQRNAQEQQKK